MTRLRSWNAYESELSGIIDDSVLTFSLASTAALSDNTWLCIDPDNPILREFVFAETVVQGAPGSITVRARGEEGSANPLGSAHDGGIKVRAVPVHQWLDEIFTDIEGNASDLSDHEGAVDPHSQYLTPTEGDAAYLRLDGGTVPTANIPMGGFKLTGLADGVTATQDAATVAQVEALDVIAVAEAGAYTDAEIVTHTAVANAHHEPYEDSDAQALIDTHADDVDAHHIKYTDGEAVLAMGAKSNSNDLNHDRYTDANARSAVDDGTYLKLIGGTVTGLLVLNGGLSVGSVAGFSAVVTFSDVVNIDGGSVSSPGLKFTGTTHGLYERTSGNGGIGFSVDGGADADVVLTASGFVPITNGLDLGNVTFPWANIEVATINGQPVSAYLN